MRTSTLQGAIGTDLGDRDLSRQSRLVLEDSGLPPSAELYDRAYAYIREHV